MTGGGGVTEWSSSATIYPSAVSEIWGWFLLFTLISQGDYSAIRFFEGLLPAAGANCLLDTVVVFPQHVPING